MARGRYKIFLGMAAGVGKTYRMLQEGQAEAEAGRDVVIGYLEPHGRAETLAQADGLEVLPRRTITYRDTQMTEMDLSAILHRAPELCLIDELAHTNVPGLEHDKRYEDIEDVLTAGIDVYSTVNVQHLESVSQRITQTTGQAIEETMPDEVIDDADEVAVVDLTPEALRTRILEGKVVPASSVPIALQRFFTKDNLDVLREMALHQVVEEVEAHRLAAEVLRQDDRLISNVPPKLEYRFLALVKPDPSANRVVRRAWEMCERLGGKLDVLWVERPRAHGEPASDRAVDDLRRLATVFGAELMVERDGDIAHGVVQAVERVRATHVVMGIPHLRTRLGLTQPSLVDRIVAEAPQLQLALVGDPPAAEAAPR